MLKVVGADVMSVGQHEATDGDTVFAEENSTNHRYRKLVLRNGKLLGAILMGWPEWMEPLSKAVKVHADVSSHLDTLQKGQWQPLLLTLQTASSK